MKKFRITNLEIKDGDFVINTEGGKGAKPTKVSTNEYGCLGIKLNGHFDWLPIGKRHKKVKFEPK